jgi:hypothetical protein
MSLGGCVAKRKLICQNGKKKGIVNLSFSLDELSPLNPYLAL